MSDESNTKWYHKIIKESFSFAIALVVLIPFMIYFGVVLIYLQDIVLLEKMSALLGGLVAMIVGYYFGQRPLKELSKQVQEAQIESEENRRDANEATVDLFELSENFENLKRQFDELIKLEEEEDE
ncbi:MAG: hypothetical protein COA77_02175 [Thaumarchaeota archaeon]|nr:MAG: hypothetical protein COA77_02175 [Nitrososphaerota archaeon]